MDVRDGLRANNNTEELQTGSIINNYKSTWILAMNDMKIKLLNWK